MMRSTQSQSGLSRFIVINRKGDEFFITKMAKLKGVKNLHSPNSLGQQSAQQKLPDGSSQVLVDPIGEIYYQLVA